MNQNPWPEGNALFEDGRSSILGVRKVGPYRFPHAKLEEDGIIVKTHIPETGRPNTFLNITSLAPETFLVGLHHEGREKAVLEIDVKIVDLLEKQQNDKLLDLEYIQLNVSKLLGLLEKVFGVPGVPASATNEDTSLPRILVHENLLLFLRDACSTLEPSLNASVQKTLDSYTLSMASNNLVGAILASLEFRKILLELSSKLGLTNNPRLRAAQRKDDQRIAAALVSIFNSKFEEAAVLGLEGDSAQCFLDVVQSALDKGFLLREDHSRMARRIIRKLSESCDRLPSSLFISGVTGREEYPTFGGGYGDIYRALHNSKPVALKRMRYFLRGADLRRINLKFCREALVWKDLHHPHILPFLGIDRDSFPSALCMVSPWMEHGTVMDYLKNHGHENVDKLLYEVAQGLQYLHSRNIVHGDLRGGNILVDEDWNACLADFGLSMFTDVTSAMTTNRGGSPYWMAPELIDPDRFGRAFARTPTTDVYAFGCVCLELYTGRPPFATLTEPAALIKILNGERPERPVGPPAISDILWHHILAYWAENPEARPATQLVVQNMKLLYPLVVLNSLSPPMSRSSTPSLLSPIDPHLTSPTFVDGVSPGPVGDQHIILYDYTGRTDDPNQTPISFNDGDTVHVLGQQGMWCEVVKVDGSIGIVPSDCLQISRSSALTEGSQSAQDHDGNGERGNIERREGGHSGALVMQFSDLRVVNQSGRSKPRSVLGILHSLDPEQQLEPRAGHLRDKELPEFLLSQGKETVNQASTTPIHRHFIERDRWQGPERAPIPFHKPFRVVTPGTLADGPISSLYMSGAPEFVEQYTPRLRSGTSPEDEVQTKGGFWRFRRKKTEEIGHVRNKSEERQPQSQQKEKEKSGFWGRGGDKDKDKDRDRERERAEMEAREREAREPQLFQECKIGVGNANVLTKALAMATPEMLRDTVIVGFHGKCTVSQELISAQIPWASAGAERSRSAKDREHERERARKVSASSINPNGNGSLSDLAIPVLTREEQLLADLLSANKQLLAALKLYTDLCRTAAEREVKLKNLYILPDGDIPRLFQVCKMGMDNASILGRVLANATPMQLTDPVIVDFHKRCTDSRELIYAKIPLASASAYHSGDSTHKNLLADLLSASKQLIEVLQLYDDFRTRSRSKLLWGLAEWDRPLAQLSTAL